ncbi:hypothetical protein ILUMI_11664 [Ignelater luminosus]|uniref:Mediator of RNA polymerase II transcription subunit 30 n=1 Tax=Ignelater luminosus TaxID=2038154 RepID=A0A8K0CVK1_IGNLU|nr:hypothetical protein ILUMI_11664 [Ignelater luminosus]
MSGSSHHFIPGFSNVQQGGMQYGGSMQNQLGNAMQNQLGNQMQVSLSNQMNTQSNTNQMMQQMSPMINSNQMYSTQSQQYGMSHQSQNSFQMQQQSQMTGLQHHSMQQPVMQQTPNVITPTPPSQPQGQQQAKEFNTASLCRIGQETVQDIVSRTQEVFQTLKTIQPPNGTPQGGNTSNEKKAKVQEQLRTIRVLFKRLRLIYEKCNENCQLQGMEYTHVESLIPFKDEIDPKHDEKKNSEAYRLACEESKEVMEQVVLKNRQLKEVIDHLRRIIWEINTMLTMRRS